MMACLGDCFGCCFGFERGPKWLPIGTHEWNKFVKPEELINLGKKNSLKLVKTDGVNFNILKNEWVITKDKSVNYISQFEKI